MKNKQAKPYYKVSTLEKGLDVLELLAEKGELSVSDTAKNLSINRASAHRFLATLRELGYVNQNGEGRYCLSFKLFELGQKTVNRLEVIKVGHSFLQELSDLYKETVNLGYWDNEEILHIDKIDSKEILRMDQPIGERAPAYCTALGKAILSALPSITLEKYLNSFVLKKFTKKTIDSKQKLVDELATIREQGYAVDDEELSLGLRCVAAPVFDYTGFPSYAISVSGPVQRITQKQIVPIQRNVRKAARHLSQALGAGSINKRVGVNLHVA